MLKLAAVFTDNMVLQQKIAVPVWGSALPGSVVTVRFARQEKSAASDASGNWQIKLDPLEACSKPQTMTVTAEYGTSLTLHNVLIGEVWICSGQSNMEMPVSLIQDSAREIAEANYPAIRLLTIPRFLSSQPLKEIKTGQWEICTPGSVSSFSAAGYFFGRELYHRLDVPVGLIHSSWGGTVAESWTSRDGLTGNPALAGLVNEDVHAGTEFKMSHEEYIEEGRKVEQKTKDVKNEGYPRGWADLPNPPGEWKEMELPGTWQTHGLDFCGILWFRKEMEVPEAWAGLELRLSIGATDKSDITYFNNVKVGSITMADRPDSWNTLRTYPVPGNLVKAGRNVIAVRVHSDKYDGGMTGPEEDMLLSCPSLPDSAPVPLSGIWKYAVESNYGRSDIENRPCALFNGMISPLNPYAVRGAIWYQGESNTSRAAQYRTLFPALIQDWRKHWGIGDFPFLFVQLANYMTAKTNPGESAWAELREAQTMTLRLPGTGMAVAIDIGESADIHPKNKQDVGLRLALNALANTYGIDTAFSGPMFKAAAREGGKLRIRFDHVNGGLECRGEKLLGFAVAGADRKFVWADAKINGDTVIVSSPGIAEPEFVRYAWADNPICNLYNAAGLPAVPFRSDMPEK